MSRVATLQSTDNEASGFGRYCGAEEFLGDA